MMWVKREGRKGGEPAPGQKLFITEAEPESTLEPFPLDSSDWAAATSGSAPEAEPGGGFPADPSVED